MPTLTLHDTTLVYRDEGQGPPLLFLHAFPLSGAMWQPQLAVLRDTFRCIVPDLRGFGGSPSGNGVQGLEMYANDVMQLLEVLNIERTAVIGLSMGGYVSFALLRARPDLVGALVLADTRPQADAPEAKQNRAVNAELAETKGLPALAAKLLPGMVAPNAPEPVREAVRAQMLGHDVAGVAAALRAMAARPNNEDVLSTIAVPTLVIVGEHDALTPPDVARAMADAIPNAEYEMIPNAGHMTNIEQPTAFSSTLRDFFKRAWHI